MRKRLVISQHQPNLIMTLEVIRNILKFPLHGQECSRYKRALITRVHENQIERATLCQGQIKNISNDKETSRKGICVFVGRNNCDRILAAAINRIIIVLNFLYEAHKLVDNLNMRNWA